MWVYLALLGSPGLFAPPVSLCELARVPEQYDRRPVHLMATYST